MLHELASALPSTPRLSDPETSDTQSPTSSSPSRMDENNNNNNNNKQSGDANVKDDNNPHALPESTQQPFLDADKYVPATLPPRASDRSSRRHRKANPNTNGRTGGGGNREAAEDDEEEWEHFGSPRSIDMKKAESMPVSGVAASLQESYDQQQQQQQQQQTAQSKESQQSRDKSGQRSSRRKDHRRVSSDGVHLMRHGLDPYSAAASDPFMQQMQMQQQLQFQQQLQQQQFYQMQQQQMQQLQQQQQQQMQQQSHHGTPPNMGQHPVAMFAPASMGGGGMYFPPQQARGGGGGGHNRVQSWQGGAPMDPNFMTMHSNPLQHPQQAGAAASASGGPPPMAQQSGRSSRRHRRVNSDGMTPVKEEDENHHETAENHSLPPPHNMAMMMMRLGQSPPPYPVMHSYHGSPSTTATPSFVSQSLPGRPMQGWSSDPQLIQHAYNMSAMPPPPSTVGYPLPQQHQQQQPSLPPQVLHEQQQQQMMGGPPPNFQQMKPKRTRRKNRQRSASSNAALPGLYGSFFTGSEDAAENVAPRPSEFNARSEIMSLTSSFRASPKISFPSTSPKQGGGGSSSSNSGTLRKQVRHASMDTSIGNLYGGNNNNNNNAFNNEMMPLVPNITMSSSDGGEMAFAAQRKTKSKALQSMRTAQTFMNDVKGVPQEATCRNIIFLLLFLFHLVGMAYIGETYGRDKVQLEKSSWDDNTNVIIDIHRVIYVASISGAFAVAVSAMALVMMTIIARRFVQVALFLLIAMSFAWGTIGIGVSSRNLVPITGFIALALSVGYTFVVWERIPFHAANLATALTAVRANAGAVLIACICQLLVLAWANYYVYAIAGVYGAMETGRLHLSHKMKTCVYVLFGISFYWTFNVLLNIVQVTIAGVVGKWWYQPGDARSFCSGNVTKPFCHASFYSLGSICCGSLLVGPVRLVRQFSAFFRPSTDVNTLMCMQQCLHCVQSCVTTCVDYIADGLNPWAFTYVGLYGYGFMDAGRHATELFKKREWTMIISDDILPNILLMMSLVIGGITGCFAFLIENLDFLKIANNKDLGTLTFSLGLVVGLVVTSVLFGMISSSVNAVIVCFASSPVDFENNHPHLSNEMRYAWREVWPGSMDVVDDRINMAQYGGGLEYMMA